MVFKQSECDMEAVNAQDVPLEVKIEDVLAGLDCCPDEIAVISGGNIPERKNCKDSLSQSI